MNHNKDILKNYAESAAFLWALRSVSLTEPQYTIGDISSLEQRIEAQLDGLMTSIDTAWEVCEKALQAELGGEVFTATVIAFRSGDMRKIQKAVTVGLTNDDTFRGLVSALGWLPAKSCHPWIMKFFNSKDIEHKYLAVSACSVRRDDPEDILNVLLQRKDCLAHEKLHARALRLIGELRRQDLTPALSATMSSDNEHIAFWANWSAVLLGNQTAVKNLRPYVCHNGPYQDIAIQLVFRVLSIKLARSWIMAMVENSDQIRAVIKATGVLGDPQAINWLITLMEQPQLARIAGESFTNITGIDLDEKELIQLIPEDSDEIPDSAQNDRSDFVDEDESLSWPEATKVDRIWHYQQQYFVTGRRYFMGKEIDLEFLEDMLLNGYQRQRQGAALELAIINKDQQLANIYQRVHTSR